MVTVKHLKNNLNKDGLVPLSPDNQCVHFQGDILSDKQHLHECGIRQGSEVYIHNKGDHHKDDHGADSGTVQMSEVKMYGDSSNSAISYMIEQKPFDIDSPSVHINAELFAKGALPTSSGHDTTKINEVEGIRKLRTLPVKKRGTLYYYEHVHVRSVTSLLNLYQTLLRKLLSFGPQISAEFVAWARYWLEKTGMQDTSDKRTLDDQSSLSASYTFTKNSLGTLIKSHGHKFQYVLDKAFDKISDEKESYNSNTIFSLAINNQQTKKSVTPLLTKTSDLLSDDGIMDAVLSESDTFHQATVQYLENLLSKSIHFTTAEERINYMRAMTRNIETRAESNDEQKTKKHLINSAVPIEVHL